MEAGTTADDRDAASGELKALADWLHLDKMTIKRTTVGR
jgi:hypothetical protein